MNWEAVLLTRLHCIIESPIIEDIGALKDRYQAVLGKYIIFKLSWENEQLSLKKGQVDYECWFI